MDVLKDKIDELRDVMVSVFNDFLDSTKQNVDNMSKDELKKYLIAMIDTNKEMIEMLSGMAGHDVLEKDREN